MRAQLRRLNAAALPTSDNHVVAVGGVALDLDACTVTVGSADAVALTRAEFKVLELLMSQPKRVFTKEQIYGSAWYDDGAVDDNTIRVIISRLRDKIGAEHIVTIRGLGYRFEE